MARNTYTFQDTFLRQLARTCTREYLHSIEGLTPALNAHGNRIHAWQLKSRPIARDCSICACPVRFSQRKNAYKELEITSTKEW